MSETLPNLYQQFLWNGAAVANGKLYSYAAGTTNPLPTYTDQTAGTQNANPTILSSKGIASIWIPQTTGYKFQLQDSSGNVLWTVDNILPIENGSIGAAQIAAGAVTSAKFAANAVTQAKIAIGAVGPILQADGRTYVSAFANGAVGTTQLASNGIQIQNFSSSIDLTGLNNSVEAVARRTDDLSGQLETMTPQYPYTAATPIGTPGTLPAGQANCARWSPDCRFLAVAHNSSPFITIYERSGTTLTKLANPVTLPAGNANYCAWSPCGNFLSVAHATTPFVTIYQRQGNTFTKLSNPGSLPATTATGVSFSPNGGFMYVSVGASNAGTMYQITGTTFTDVTAGDLTTYGLSTTSSWSIDSQFICFCTNGLPAILQRSVKTFSFYASIVAGSEQPALNSSWSPDGQYLVFAWTNSPYISLYSVSGTTFTKLTGASGISGGVPTTNGAVSDVSFSPNGQFIAAAYSGTNKIRVWEKNGPAPYGDGAFLFSQVTDPVTLPGSNGLSISWPKSSQFLSIAVASSPYVLTYQTAGTLPTNGSLYSRNFADV